MIIVAGGGIGGLTLGCALSKARKPFQIFERAGELRPIGAGIALSPNAFQALAHIGMDDRVRSCGWDLELADLCDSRGRLLMRARVPKLAAGVTKAMTRANLQQALIEELGTTVQTGRAVVDYQSTSSGVRVRMADGEEIEAELLVGADGLRSSVRRAMRGNELLRYSGQTSWRGLVTGVEINEPHCVTESWGPCQRFGMVPIGASHVYWFAVANAPVGERDEIDPRHELRRRFAGWHAPIDRLLALTPPDQVIRTDIFDRPPINCWVDGRAVLLGDAAHPMTPNLGMGACQAIEDAVVLADALSREPSVDAALTRYQSRRISRANSFVERSFRFGQVAHTSNAPLRWFRDQAIRALRLVPDFVISRAMARDFDFRL
ncbi:MAG: auaG [Verrucomicrobiales bacterium]|nr:auaG [Verrucomicrobiales bacterium]